MFDVVYSIYTLLLYFFTNFTKFFLISRKSFTHKFLRAFQKEVLMLSTFFAKFCHSFPEIIVKFHHKSNFYPNFFCLIFLILFKNYSETFFQFFRKFLKLFQRPCLQFSEIYQNYFDTYFFNFLPPFFSNRIISQHFPEIISQVSKVLKSINFFQRFKNLFLYAQNVSQIP